MELTQRDLIDLAIYAQYKDELYHHGILGMKWGVRRYQNEDGSLTPEGQRRYRETGDAERIMRTHTRMNAASGVFGGGLIPGIAAAVGTKTAMKRMDDATAKEKEQVYKDWGRVGRNVSGALFGGGFGGTMGYSLAAVPVTLLTANPVLGATAGYGAAAIGGALGGIGGWKAGGKSYDKNYDKNMEKNRYVKRTKKELEEYDREHQQG